jgi:hypothetical protein
VHGRQIRHSASRLVAAHGVRGRFTPRAASDDAPLVHRRADIGYLEEMDASERFEQLIAFLSTHLPSPVQQEEENDGTLVFTGGSPGEVVARLTNASVVVAQYAVRWETPFLPVVQPRRVGVVKWRRLPESTVMNVVGQLIRGARDMRLSGYGTCQLCGETKPPEWMDDRHVCQSCSASAFGSVH